MDALMPAPRGAISVAEASGPGHALGAGWLAELDPADTTEWEARVERITLYVAQVMVWAQRLDAWGWRGERTLLLRWATVGHRDASLRDVVWPGEKSTTEAVRAWLELGLRLGDDEGEMNAIGAALLVLNPAFGLVVEADDEDVARCHAIPPSDEARAALRRVWLSVATETAESWQRMERRAGGPMATAMRQTTPPTN